MALVLKKMQRLHQRDYKMKNKETKTPVGGSAMHNVQEEHMTPREKMLLARKKNLQRKKRQKLPSKLR